jgi:hypothetical protein
MVPWLSLSSDEVGVDVSCPMLQPSEKDRQTQLRMQYITLL